MSESSALIARLRHAAESGRCAAPVRGVGAGDWQATGLAGAQLHEIFARHADDAASGAGFALGLLLAARRAPLLWLRTEAAERQGGQLHATGLNELGGAPDALLMAVVRDEIALLRAAGDAARCAGLGGLVVEAWGRAPAIDLTASRRLMLAAEQSGVTILMLRIAAEPTPSAAATRWSVTAAPSQALAANAPGHPGLSIELLRQRAGPAGQQWRVEWNRDTQSFFPALSGADLPVAADRAAALDPPAPLRRTG